MTEQGSRYQTIRNICCHDCPFRPTCAQFEEQMDVCYDALLLQHEAADELPSFTQVMEHYEEEEE